MQKTAHYLRYSGITLSGKRSAGFTLIELLAVITIILIVTAAIMPSFSSYLKNQNVKQAAEQVKSDLRNIQNKAVTGALSDTLIGGVQAAYWGVRFGNNTNTYEYFISTNTTCPSPIPAAQLQGSGTISSDLNIKTGAVRCIFFSMANGDITTNLPSNLVIVGISTSVAAGDCRRVLFNLNGLIYNSNSLLCT